MAHEEAPLDPKYEIRLARESEGKAIADFIGTHWRKDHILSRDRTLLDWQHFDAKNRRYNFLLGVLRETGEIHGVLGLIPLNQYDPGMEFTRLISMAIWRVRDDARGYKLGRHMLSYLEDVLTPETISAIAINRMTLPMYQARGFTLGQLGHYFFLNPRHSKFELVRDAQSSDRTDLSYTTVPERTLEAIGEAEVRACEALFSAQAIVPRKTPEYVVRRYLRHPCYKYQAWAIRERRRTLGLLATRICRRGSACAIRIVEFDGLSEALRGLQREWVKLLEQTRAEYVDFYNAGVSHEDLLASGFRKRDGNTGIVVPNYFEPFEPKNIEIDYAIRPPQGMAYRIVKGDSDQDRPNFLERPPA